MSDIKNPRVILKAIFYPLFLLVILLPIVVNERIYDTWFIWLLYLIIVYRIEVNIFKSGGRHVLFPRIVDGIKKHYKRILVFLLFAMVLSGLTVTGGFLYNNRQIPVDLIEASCKKKPAVNSGYLKMLISISNNSEWDAKEVVLKVGSSSEADSGELHISTFTFARHSGFLSSGGKRSYDRTVNLTFFSNRTKGLLSSGRLKCEVVSAKRATLIDDILYLILNHP